MLLRLTYASQLAPDCGKDCVSAIVEHSAAANQRRGVTGVLAVDGARVLQILEGNFAEVVALFERIAQDRRHFGVVELGRKTIEAPHFGKWGMVTWSMADAVLMADMA